MKYHAFSLSCPCRKCATQRARNKRAEERLRAMRETTNRG